MAGLIFFVLPTTAQTNNSAAYTWTTFAGSTDTGAADGVGPDAQFYTPRGAAADTNGNVYVADQLNDTIRKITPAGQVSTIAGFPEVSGSADGVNSAARFNNPFGIAADKAGNLYVTDSGNGTIRKITPVGTNWVTTTIAGFPGKFGSADGIGTNASFDISSNNFAWIAAQSSSNLFVADTFNDTIRKITQAGTNWVVSTIAGLAGKSGSSDGTGTNGQFAGPDGIAVDVATNIYVADSGNNAIRKIAPVRTNWVVTTIAGRAGSGFYGNTDGTNGNARFNDPLGLAADANGNLYVWDSQNITIRKITPVGTNWVVSTLAGGSIGYDDGTGTNAEFISPWGMAVDPTGNIYVADSGAEEIRKITSAGLVTTLAGSPQTSGNIDGLGDNARFNLPSGVAVDGAGYVYVADSENYTIRKITPLRLVSTLAGQAGVSGSTNGVGNNARFGGGEDGAGFDVAVDGADNVYVAESKNQTIRKITPAGVVTTIAGSVTNSGSADGTNGAARFNNPYSVAVDTNGNLYVADTFNTEIRKIKPVGTNWVVTTIAGSVNNYGSADGVGTNAQFNEPWGITADSAGNVYVADTGNNTIRKLAPVTNNWVVTTIAGWSLAANSQSTDGIGTNAQFVFPVAIAADNAGNLYVADGDNVIRKLTPVGGNWAVTTIGGLAGSTGSTDGSGSVSRFLEPNSVAVDNAGNIYVAALSSG